MIATAQTRAELIIFTGGLGPTKDDLTKETIASVLGVELTTNAEALESIEAYFKQSNRIMTPNNKNRQLYLKVRQCS